MERSQIFSQEALDKLRSPEKLDEMLPITTPISWMALIAILVLLFSVVLWSIFGAFTVKADGMGLIMDSAGVLNISERKNFPTLCNARHGNKKRRLNRAHGAGNSIRGHANGAVWNGTCGK